MLLDRSTKTFIAIFALVAGLILVVNHIIDDDPVGDWALAAVLLLISGTFWVWLWQEKPAASTSLTVPGMVEASPPPVQEWIINEEVVAALEDAATAHEATVEAQEQEQADIAAYEAAKAATEQAEPAPEVKEITEVELEATLDDDPDLEDLEEVAEEAAEGDQIAVKEIGEAMAAPDPETEAEDIPQSEEVFQPQETEHTEDESQLDDTSQSEVTDQFKATTYAHDVATDRDAADTIEVEAVADQGEADDLTRVEGIGPKYSATLMEMGITTFEQVSKMTETELTTIIRDAGMRRPPSVGTWADQAALAAAGKWDELAALQAALTAGRRD